MLTSDGDTRPQWLRSRAVGTSCILVDGVLYPYTVVASGLEPLLPYTVGFPIIEEDTLFIAENVPEEFRPFILRYEVRQAVSTLLEVHRYITALCRELEECARELDSDAYLAYVVQRSTFFAALVQYYETQVNQANARHPDFLDGIRLCKELLNQIAAILHHSQRKAETVE